MGRSNPEPTKIVMPSNTAPTIYKDVVPLQSYQQAGEYLGRIKKQTQDILNQQYAQVGTPAEIGARKAGVESQAAASYLSSLPTGDKYIQQTTGISEPYKEARKAAESRLSEAQATYANALQKKNERPPELDTSTPSWATSTIPEGMPGYSPPSPPPAPAPAPAPAPYSDDPNNVVNKIARRARGYYGPG